MGHAIHRWKALTLLNPTMPEFKCVTRVNFELYTFKESKLPFMIGPHKIGNKIEKV